MNLYKSIYLTGQALRVLGAAILALLVSSPATAFPRPTIYGQIANPHIEGSVIFWDGILLEYDRITLNVTAPCGDFSQTFQRGETPFFDVGKLSGEVDGTYTFDLVATPTIDPSVQDLLAEVRGTPQEQQVVQSLWDDGKLPRGPFRQAGFFEVERGLILPQDTQEEGAKSLTPGTGLEARQPGDLGTAEASLGDGLRNASAAQTIAQSLCVGFDCPGSPTFDDTTILMMENNTRIKFDDTSTAASFPRNDWELEANSRNNGGGSYFAIHDCGQSSQGGCADDPVFLVEAGARRNALRVDSQGDVGIGTANPVVEIHAVRGDTPTLRLEQDTSSGFAAQTWDVAGNETSFFIRDATNGSQLPFRIRPGADSNSLVIDSDNDVGVGVLSPSSALHVVGSSNAMLRLENNVGAARIEFRDTGGNGPGGVNVDWDFRTTTGDAFIINGLSNGGNEFVLNSVGDLTLAGSLTVGPGGCTGCDLVFKQPEVYVESIEEHAEYMWKNSHLPGVGPTPEDAPMNLSKKTGGILNELEKAHIYIEQLHQRLKEKDLKLDEVLEKIESLTSKNAELHEKVEALAQRD